jgi:hypothetical protein
VITPTGVYDNNPVLSFSTETKTKENIQGANQPFDPIIYTGITVNLSPDLANNPDYNGLLYYTEFAIDIQVQVTMGSSVTGSNFDIMSAWGAPNTSGVDINGIASDMLNLITLVAFDYPLVSIPAGILNIILNYVQMSNQTTFTFAYGSTGPYLNDIPNVWTGYPANNNKNDLIVYLVDPPQPGTYPLQITTTLTVRALVYEVGSPFWVSLSATNIVNTFQYYYGP